MWLRDARQSGEFGAVPVQHVCRRVRLSGELRLRVSLQAVQRQRVSQPRKFHAFSQEMFGIAGRDPHEIFSSCRVPFSVMPGTAAWNRYEASVNRTSVHRKAK